MADKYTDLYQRLKTRPAHYVYDEEIHCPLVIRVMADYERGTPAHFCKKAGIEERQFHYWCKNYPIFKECYDIGKAYARVEWEKEGMRVRDIIVDGINTPFEHWRMMGYARFGISKTARMRLQLTPGANAVQHYKELIDQAGDGEFTASEFKQVCEGLSMGLRVHESITMQEQLDGISNDVLQLTNGNNQITDQKVAPVSQDSLASEICEPRD